MDRAAWAALLRENIDDMARLVAKYHPSRPQQGEDVLDAPAYVADAVRETIRKETPILFDAPVSLRLALDSGDLWFCWRILSDSWWGMPEDPIIHRERGFYVLCDLCSYWEQND